MGRFKSFFQLELASCYERATRSSAIDNVFFPSHMRCLSNGNYDRMQCVTRYVIQDTCFCIDDQVMLNGTITYRYFDRTNERLFEWRYLLLRR